MARVRAGGEGTKRYVDGERGCGRSVGECARDAGGAGEREAAVALAGAEAWDAERRISGANEGEASMRPAQRPGDGPTKQLESERLAAERGWAASAEGERATMLLGRGVVGWDKRVGVGVGASRSSRATGRAGVARGAWVAESGPGLGTRMLGGECGMAGGRQWMSSECGRE